MKRLFLLLSFLTFAILAYSQQKAVTETGETVVLYSDGRWVYTNQDSLVASDIATNPKKFEKNNKASFLVKSSKIDVGCWLDPKKWTFQKATGHDAAEFEIENAELGLYGLMITENLQLPVESLANIALGNARKAAPDVQLISKEYRNVNGIKVLLMHMTGTIQDILFSYYGYYYATETGAVQFLVYSSKETVDSHIEDIESLLNGLVEIDN